MSHLALRRTILAIFLTALFLPAAAFAGEWTPFDKAAFDKAQASGKTVLVSVHADW
jgi:hypothetical protein